jgi:hypothetical protein
MCRNHLRQRPARLLTSGHDRLFMAGLTHSPETPSSPHCRHSRRLDTGSRIGFGAGRWISPACTRAGGRIEGNRPLRNARFPGKPRGVSEFSLV